MGSLDKIINNIGSPNGDINDLSSISNNFGEFNIRVLGVGGAGCNVIESILSYRKWDKNISFYAINTDIKALRKLEVITNTVLIGKETLRGSGSGGDPNLGEIAAEENINKIETIVKGADLVIIVAGLGKGTGSGASPVIAKKCKELAITTIAIVNFPSCSAEGTSILENAIDSYGKLKSNVTSITRISNEKIMNNRLNLSFYEAYKKANEDVCKITSSIVDMINIATDMNLDFADVKKFFTNNPVFMYCECSIHNKYKPEELDATIKNFFANSYYDINPNSNEECQVLLNIQINKTTSSSIVNDIKNSLGKIAKNRRLSFRVGLEYIQIEDISFILFLTADDTSTNEDEEPINNIESTTIFTSVQKMPKIENIKTPVSGVKFQDFTIKEEDNGGVKTIGKIVETPIDTVNISKNSNKTKSYNN